MNEEKPGWLGTATLVAGLLAGAVAVTYLLGGVIVAMRLLFEGFSASAVVTLLGQLPRELVISTALLEVAAPAVTIGIGAALVFGVRLGPRPRPVDDGFSKGDAERKRREAKVDLLTSQPRRNRTFALLIVISVGMMVPAFLQAIDASGLSRWLLLGAVIFGLLVTFALAAGGWYTIRRIARKGWQHLPKAGAAGAVVAGMAVIPAVMFAGAIDFEDAQACVEGGAAPVEGLLVGETADRLLLATDFEDEESVLSLPEKRVTKSEYGDLASEFPCEPTELGSAAEAALALGEHGGELERKLAADLRPLLRFDSAERWRPLEVESFAAERFDDGRGHGACSTGATPPCPTLSTPDELRPGIEFIDVHGDAANGADFGTPSDCARRPVVRDCESGEDSAMYYRRTTHNGRWYWDYWWFFRYNDYTGEVNACRIICGDHEGDWEGVTVITTASTEPEILGAVYATHKERVLVGAQLLPAVGTHPLVFVAEGTHASYPFRCASDCDQYSPLPGFELTKLPDESHDGAVRWANDADERCESVDCVRPFPELAGADPESLPFAAGWAAWGGAWGETCHAGCRKGFESSPRSPGRQLRYRCPWVPTRLAKPGAAAGALTGSRRVGDTRRLLAACLAQRGGL